MSWAKTFSSSTGTRRQIRIGFPELAAELVRLKVDVIVAGALAIRAAKNATKTIPIVMATSGDPVALRICCQSCAAGR